MELRQLRYAVALAEHGNFSRAARALGIAQPPLSRQIAALERELDVRLFDRTPHGVLATAAGDVLCARARAILADVDAAARETGKVARGRAGTLRVGSISSALSRTLPPLLTGFRAAHPGLRLECRELATRRSTEALLSGEIDVAIGRGAPDGVGAERLTAIPLDHDHAVLLCHHAHPFASRPHVDRAQVRGQPLIVTSAAEEPAVLAAVDEIVAGTDPELITEARDLHTAVGLVACGIGVALMPFGSRALAVPGTHVVDIRPTIRIPALHLTFRSDDRSLVVESLLTTAADLFPGVAAHRDRRRGAGRAAIPRRSDDGDRPA